VKVLSLLLIIAAAVVIFAITRPAELGAKKLQDVSALAPDPLSSPTPKPRSTLSIEMYERWAKETLSNKKASKADKEKAVRYLEEANRLRTSQ